MTFSLLRQIFSRFAQITVAIAPVMAKTKSKCASGLKIIQFFLIFENKSKMSFRFEKKNTKKTRKTEKIETKRKNIEKTNKKRGKKREKQRKKLEVFCNFLDLIIKFGSKTRKPTKIENKNEKKQSKKQTQNDNKSKIHRKKKENCFFATNSRFCLCDAI